MAGAALQFDSAPLCASGLDLHEDYRRRCTERSLEKEKKDLKALCWTSCSCQRLEARFAEALFFSSSAPTPDSDPECEPSVGPFESLVQTVTVGFAPWI